MFIPPYLQRWVLLNLVRLLTITACALVIGSTIELLCRDFAAYHKSTSDVTAGYYTGTDIPKTFLGVFWMTLHHTYLVVVLFLVLLSELSLPVPTLHRFFKNSLPFLGPNWGTGFLGALLMLLASDTLSRSSQSRIPLASNWILAITGLFNVATGLIWRVKGKMLRSPTAWQHSVAERMETLADIKARAEELCDKEESLPSHFSELKSNLPQKGPGALRSILTRFRPISGGRPAAPSDQAALESLLPDDPSKNEARSEPLLPSRLMTERNAAVFSVPALPTQAVTRGATIGAFPAAVPFVPFTTHDESSAPTSSLSKVAPLAVGEETSGDSSFRSSSASLSSKISSCSSRSSHDREHGGRAALLEALSEHCRQASADSNFSANPNLPHSLLRSAPAAKAVRFGNSPSHNATSSISSIYTDQGLPLLPAFESPDSQTFEQHEKQSYEAEELLQVETAMDEPQLSPSVVASYKAAMLEAEAKARCQKLKKSLYLGSDKWLADRRKDENTVPVEPATPARPYTFL